MMDRTDRHCRVFHRQLTRHALLFTEMVTAEAILRGDRDHLLAFDPAEHPVALQIGGSDPDRLAEAARIGASYGYDEINLNVGCPSDRVKSGSFGACLMLRPALVAECVAAMKETTPVRVTVKCRLGVDDQDPEAALDALADAVLEAGVDGLWVHARKAWLNGLNPKQNRTIPPLDYDRVVRLKQRLPNIFIGINGGLTELDQAVALLGSVDGVMLGRAAYERPGMLCAVDRLFYGQSEVRTAEDAVSAMISYAAEMAERGVPVGRITRHLIGLFHGMAGARNWRRVLTEGACRADAGPWVIEQALAEHMAASADAASLAA